MLKSQAWRAALPLGKGSYYLGTQPLIHKGFLQAWQGVAAPVIDAVKEIVGRASITRTKFQILVTGLPLHFHSAALCDAYDHWFTAEYLHLLYSLKS